jgi:3,6-diketocamphane 1,6-monooxygenase
MPTQEENLTMAMDTGLIFHPYMKPGRTARQTFEWGVQSAIACDKIGFTTMMISEHASQIWENIPAPELIMAAAALQTDRIKFAPMAHILPHHNPTKLAMTVGWLSQILEGRYFMGIGAGAYPLASYMHGIKEEDQNTEHLNDMVRESLTIMEKIWKREPFFFEGKYWDAGYPEEEPAVTEEDEQHKLANYAPWGGAFPEFAVTGFSANSPSMKLAGERNFKPVSIYSGLDALKRHWEIYSEANIKAGFTPDRQRHAVSHTILRGHRCRGQAPGDGRPGRLLLQPLSDPDLAALRHDGWLCQRSPCGLVGRGSGVPGRQRVHRRFARYRG